MINSSGYCVEFTERLFKKYINAQPLGFDMLITAAYANSPKSDDYLMRTRRSIFAFDRLS